MDNNELSHYGILGMKWGVRRTPEQLARARGSSGKKSDSSDDGKKKAAAISKAKSSKSTTEKKPEEEPKKKKVSEMSDDELNKAVRRLQLEQQYRQLNPEKVSAGQRFANKVVKDVVVPAATTVARNTLQKFLEKEVKKLTSLDVKDNNKKKDD